jgi:hypothetical protein
MAWPPNLADFWTHGLSAAACVPEIRSVESVDVASSTFVLPSHGLASGALVQLFAKGAAAALPPPASAAAAYAVQRLSSHAFKLAGLSLSGPPAGLVQVLEDVEPRILAILAACASDLQARATAFAAPWASAPPWAVRRACHLAAADVATWLRVVSPLYSYEQILARAAAADAFINKLERGMATAEPPVDATPSTEEAGAIAWADQDRGWGSPDGALR